MNASEDNLGIYSIGTYLPDEVRTNDWWPEETVDQWGQRQVWDGKKQNETRTEPTSAGARHILQAIADHAGDPFHGSRERRVMPQGMSAADMEVEAAELAIARSGLRRDQIDLLLGFTLIPDFISGSNACILQGRLGLPSHCFTMTADSVCNSFQMQLAVAEQMIAGGRARFGLLVQSSAVWRVTPPEQSFSIHFGDGASAVVVGPVSSSRGLLAQSHRTKGSAHKALVCTVPGKNWWEDGRIVTASLDAVAAREMILQMADHAQEVLGEALSESGHRAADVGFFACHQPTVWLRRVVQEHVGLINARFVDTYSWAGSLSAANLPLILEVAQDQGLLSDGDLVAMFQGGTGMTYSGTILRWGR